MLAVTKRQNTCPHGAYVLRGETEYKLKYIYMVGYIMFSVKEKKLSKEKNYPFTF